MSYKDSVDVIKSIDYDDKNQEKQVEEDLHAVLKEGHLIRDKVKDPELKERFKEEYRELEKSILDAVNIDFKVTHNERMTIMLELSDIITLADEHNISTKFRKRDSFL
jgi:hypothetical protein